MDFEDLCEEYPNQTLYTIQLHECKGGHKFAEPVLEGLHYVCPECGRILDRPRTARPRKNTTKARKQKKAVPLITVFAEEGGCR